MKYQVGQLVVGKVYNVKPYALFMSFEDGVTGLLHISEISDSFIRDIEKYGSVGGRTAYQCERRTGYSLPGTGPDQRKEQHTGSF